MTEGEALGPAVIDERLATVCEDLSARLDELSGEIADKLREQEPVYATLITRAELVAAVHANIEVIVESVQLNRVQSLSGPRNTGRRRAEQGVPLEIVLSGYRLGVMHLWQELVDGCEELDRALPDPDRPARASRALLGSASMLWTAFDMHAHALAATYHEFATERFQRDDRRRQSLLTMLFSGEPGPEQTLVDVATLLGIPSGGPFVALVTDPLALGAETSRTALNAVALHAVWKSSPRFELGLVTMHRPEDLDRLTQQLTRLGLGRVGISRPFARLSTIPAAVAQAQLARDAGRAGDQVVTGFDEAQVAGLIISSPDLAAGIAQHVFGPLREMPEAEQDVLIHTLRTWFLSAGSTEAVAEALHCHPNTVRYRLNKLMTLLGRDLKSPLDIVDLYLASEARRLQPSRPAPAPAKARPRRNT
ncbi:helix-turn-helix domain-containing protein [Nocardia sp. NPDC050712]|uniref:PucR family transcriptional regulator n=1 Tax=Nocardia sp. NPDC050712 TaxID=3155518 RepID=UPI0033D49C8E